MKTGQGEGGSQMPKILRTSYIHGPWSSHVCRTRSGHSRAIASADCSAAARTAGLGLVVARCTAAAVSRISASDLKLISFTSSASSVVTASSAKDMCDTYVRLITFG